MRRLVRICLPLLLLLGSLPILNLALFHAWAAGGPPTPCPAWHLKWANIFLGAWLATLTVAGCTVYWLRPK